MNKKYEFDLKYNNITNINITNATDDEIKNVNDAHNDIFTHDRTLFFVIFGIYCTSIILSIILFAIFNLIFENDDSIEEDNNKNIRVCQIFGYTIYSNLYTNKVLNKSDYEEEKKEEIKKIRGLLTILGVIWNFIKYYILKLCECIKLLFFSCKSCCDEIICGYFCCGKKNAKCCLCCCCNSISEKQYDINEHFFCYCYKGQRKLKWFDKLIRNETQKKLIPIMMEFFILQLTTIGFEKIYNDMNDDEYDNFGDETNVRIYNGIFILSLLFFLYITISFGSLFNYLTKDEKFQSLKGFVETISNDILNGTYGVIIFNAFYSFYFSIKFLIKGFNEDDNSIKSFILFPIFMNKFYFFTFTNVASVYTDDEDGIELVSFSTLISIYLSIWDTIIGFITDYIPLNGLFIIQIIISSFIIIFTLFIVIIFLFFIKLFWLSFLYMLSFIFTFGGVWFCNCFKKHNFYRSCRCCNKYLLPCSKQEFHMYCYECLQKCIGQENYDLLNEKIG